MAASLTGSRHRARSGRAVHSVLCDALTFGDIRGHFLLRRIWAPTPRGLGARLGLTVLMAEQNFHQAIRVADRGYVIVHSSIA
jgi:hypothetical protein